MPRTAGRRTWIKLYPIDCLEGSIRYQLEADERGVWYDLLNLSAICATPGTISDKDARSYPHSFIANRLNITVELLERSLSKCIEEGRISENDTGIHITNWAAYQSEYERQKPYREKKKGEREPIDAREAERLSLIGIRHKAKRKELGRELTTEERLELADEIDEELDKKYGRDEN